MHLCMCVCVCSAAGLASSKCVCMVLFADFFSLNSCDLREALNLFLTGRRKSEAEEGTAASNPCHQGAARHKLSSNIDSAAEPHRTEGTRRQAHLQNTKTSKKESEREKGRRKANGALI